MHYVTAVGVRLRSPEVALHQNLHVV